MEAQSSAARMPGFLAHHDLPMLFVEPAGGAIVDVNEAAARFYGYSVEALRSMRIDQVNALPPDEVARRRAEAASGGQHVFHLPHRLADGSLRQVEVHSSSVHTESGPVLFSVIIDLTQRVGAEAALATRRSEQDSQRLRATLDSLFDPHVVLTAVRDPSGTVVDFEFSDANEAACADNRIAREDLLGRRLLDLLPCTGSSGLLARYAAVVETGEPLVLDDFAYDNEIQGDRRRYDIRANRVGESLVFTWREVTDRSAAAAALAASEEHYRLLADNSSDVVMHLRRGMVHWVSPSIRETLGWQPADITDVDLFDYVHPHDLGSVRVFLAEVESGAVRVARMRMRNSSGAYNWVEVHARSFVGASGAADGSVISFRAIDTEVVAERELNRRARTDALTGLLNRSEVMSRLEALAPVMKRPGEGIAILFCDLDLFKTINDTHGHVAGDVVLRTVADRILSSVRARDLVARTGGDEIIVALDGVHDMGQALVVAEKIRAAVGHPVIVPGGPMVSTTASIGVATTAGGGEIEDLLARADAAMYRAKQGGRNRVVSLDAS